MDEIEVKFRISDPDEIRKRLMAAGAECRGSVFERNVMFDTPDERLLKEDKLLRIRKSNGCIVTYKGPRDHDHEFKKRTEVNFDVKSPEMMEAMFRGLGYLPKHMYEKKRETWELSGTEVVIDEVPVMGFFTIHSTSSSSR